MFHNPLHNIAIDDKVITVTQYIETNEFTDVSIACLIVPRDKIGVSPSTRGGELDAQLIDGWVKGVFLLQKFPGR